MRNFQLAAVVAGMFGVLGAPLSTRAQTIPEQIDAILAGSAVSGNSWSILVENNSGSMIYYQKNPDSGEAPASNTKIFTSSAAFGLLGTNYAFQTRVYRNGTVVNGVLNGDLNLVCEHDITWNTSVFSNPRAPLDFISAKVKALGVTNVTGNIQCYGCCFYNLSETDAANHDAVNQLGYNAAAATNFAAALASQGITISGVPKGQTGFNPPGVSLYTYYSTNLTYGGKPLRLDVACKPMLKVSHNVMADALCRHLGYKLGGVDSFTAGALQVLRWMTNSAGIATNGIVMNDGSGLSHGNRFTARETVSLVRYMTGAFPSWAGCLPIGCVDGTISGRFCGTDGAGQVHAKTGSLSISIALSGYIDNQYDNQRYYFSFLANKTSINQTATRNAIDAAVVLFGARGVPISPRLRLVTGAGPGSISLAWSDDGFVRSGYRVYRSADGISFDPPINLPPAAQSCLDAGLPPGARRYYKVSVLGSGGESRASCIYGAEAGTNARVLVVDGDDRWQFQTTENPACTNHAFCAIAEKNITGAAFDTAHHTAILDGAVDLTNYSAVVWLLGEESSQDETFSTPEQGLVTSYLNSGGALFVSGAEIAWDLDHLGSTTDKDFYHNELKASYFADDAGTYAFTPVGNGIFAGGPAGGFDNGSQGTYNVDFPDVLMPVNGGTAALNYLGGTGGPAAIQYDGGPGGFKLVNFGFPFETITNSVERDRCMSSVLQFFGVLDPPRFQSVTFDPAARSVTLAWNSSSGLKYRVEYKNELS
ncbi:MAG TPA: D-alanyl-D-alanine carboxypeptidase, partial [Verrucomicrobiae bacterium]|nr:D-alanyl-D-alanine carboxypeptidase [Verrucomicrobiae bacterium]